MFSISGSGFAPTVAPAAVRSAAVSPVMAIERSASIPFLKRPPALDGTMVGDVGFDPLGITTTIKELGGDLNYVREAELMHGRQSMLALVGFVFPGAHPMTCAPPSSVRRARQPRGAAAPPLHRLLLQRLGLLTRRAPLLLAAVVGKLPVDWNEAVSTNPIAAQYEVHMKCTPLCTCERRVCARHAPPPPYPPVPGPPLSDALAASLHLAALPREFGSRRCASPPLQPALPSQPHPSQPHPSPRLPSRSCRPRFWRSSSSRWPWPRACAPRSSSRAIALPVRRPTYYGPPYDGPPYYGPPYYGPPNDGPPNDGLTYYGPTQLWPHLPTASLAAYGHAHHGYY